MSNPTMLVEPFSNSLGDFTGVAPTRYDSGLWVEEATTNLISNPTCVTNTTGWVTFANRSLARVTSLPAALPNELASLVTTGWGVTATNDQAASSGICSFSVSLSNAVHAFSIYAYIPTAFSASGVSLRALSFTSATGTITAAANMSLRDQWQRIEMGPFTPDAGDTGGDMNLTTSGASAWLSGETIYFAAAQAEQKGHATSFVLSSLGSGYSASPSPHSRAASSASLTMDEPASVACWYREGYSGAKQFAYLDTLGQLGDYGDISYAAGDLTISTSRNLVIGPFAAFDRALTDTEQARLAATQSWSLSTVVAFPYRRIRSQFQLRPY